MSALAPLVRYDFRFADALGKWLMSAFINAQYFFGDRLASDRQSAPAQWTHNPGDVIPYEGLRKCDFSRPAGRCLHGEAFGPFGTGQNCGDLGVKAGSGKCSCSGRPDGTKDYSTDIGLYGGAFVGLIGGVCLDGGSGLQFDLSANDRFAPPSFPTVLLYNPDPAPRSMTVDVSTIVARYGPRARVDLYDTTMDSIVVSGASLTGPVVVTVGPARAAVLVALAQNATLHRDRESGAVSVDSIVIRFPVPGK